MGKLNKEFCENVKTRELIKLVHQSQIDAHFYNSKNFWYFWDNTEALDHNYFLCYRYLDKVDFFEFKKTMLDQITASYLDDSNDKDNA